MLSRAREADDAPTPSNVRQFDINLGVLLGILSEPPPGVSLQYRGIPHGSKLVGTSLNRDLELLTLYVEHASFPATVVPAIGALIGTKRRHSDRRYDDPYEDPECRTSRPLIK